ncbi:MAG TPA: prepilin-type N-terminal cleavage/methylation domain-containing protein [Gemmatimonadaceae bacterium]|jgi:prepilin-type N-terminal cleavage/methylation domain-containing protein|nr:prepilin-type N-terminal cleavage/methylation domain-containing protein [Gemmatimonadaceae bacterium]
MPRLSARGRGRRGVTLVELLVAITILAIVGGAVLSVLTQQQRFYRDANEWIGLRRELRNGAGMLPTELRGISSVGGDVTEMLDSALYFNANFGSAVVCARGTRTIDIPPTNLTKHTLSSWYSQPHPGDIAFVFNDSVKTGSADDRWDAFTIKTFEPNTTTCAQTAYLTPADVSPGWRITIADAHPNISTLIQTGAVIRFGRPVRYSLFQPTVGPGEPWYLGYAEQTDVAGVFTSTDVVGGPFEDYVEGAGGGVRFAYFNALNAPLTNLAQAASLARVDVVLQARSTAPSALSGAALRDSTAFRIALRNRQ